MVYWRDGSAVIAGVFATVLPMYVGVVAYHRLVFHRSFACHKYLEYGLVFIANLAGMGGPVSLLRIHERRDWAQRSPRCHSYFARRSPILIDGFQQLFCELELEKEPQFAFEIKDERFYRHLESCWYLYQIPIAGVLFLAGGPAWVCSGVFLKIFAVQFGHSFAAHLLHHYGERPALIPGAGTQGGNIPVLALLTFGESYHNNHHRCPEAASVSFEPGQIDPAFWLILVLQRCGLAHDVIRFNRQAGPGS